MEKRLGWHGVSQLCFRPVFLWKSLEADIYYIIYSYSLFFFTFCQFALLDAQPIPSTGFRQVTSSVAKIMETYLLVLARNSLAFSDPLSDAEVP